jgi:hypothetical protein
MGIGKIAKLGVWGALTVGKNWSAGGREGKHGVQVPNMTREVHVT